MNWDNWDKDRTIGTFVPTTRRGRLGQMGHIPLGMSQKSQQRCATFDLGLKAVDNFFQGALI
jgi:hypothetical protein